MVSGNKFDHGGCKLTTGGCQNISKISNYISVINISFEKKDFTTGFSLFERYINYGDSI